MEAGFNTTVLRNTTSSAHAQQTYRGWTPILIIQLLLACASVVLNLAMLIVQFLPQTQVTAFTIYLVAIAIGHIVVQLVTKPFSLINYVTGRVPGGQSLCAFYVYFQFVFSMIPVLLHVLIAINRLWAVTYPVSYNQRHNKKTASLLCLGVVAYVHVVPLAVFMLEFFYFGPTDKFTSCQPGAGGIIEWRRADFVLHRVIPLALVIGVYIYVMAKRWTKRRIGGQIEGNRSTDHNSSNKPVAGGHPASTELQSSVVRRRKVKPYIVLTVTSISVLMCWVPSDVYWALVYLYMTPPTWVHTVTSTMYSVQTVFDPLMWLFSMR
ncbi:5-hydroxytryptamine receptor 1B-like [Paramacrobiotus metropolitanus]|uniref:5-hydroxytryptamine receptor 1B-like n=1 Tax=Paramacrobiotus metropolitanus TaxID=2943436 RepID=UPI0024461A63|nr:5-hydroxytryptamine receptor 1B-like [Paramacrobiotus metropolitanus]